MGKHSAAVVGVGHSRVTRYDDVPLGRLTLDACTAAIADAGLTAADIEATGWDNCMFETDFPHPTCLYPQPLNGIAKTLEDAGVSYETKKKLLGGTAARVYNIDLPED